MTADQIAIVDMNGKWLDGPFKPSSEVPMHTAVMRARKDVKATVHTHGMFATIAAMSGELLPITPPQAEFVPVGIVPFTMPGSNDVADKVVEALGEEGRAVLIKNHGMFCCGKDMKAAMAATIYTEEMAQGTYANLAIISHSSSEFILDFIRVVPGAPKAQVKSRVILTPDNAKRLLFALQDNLAKFEEQANGKTAKFEDFVPPIGGVKGEA